MFSGLYLALDEDIQLNFIYDIFFDRFRSSWGFYMAYICTFDDIMPFQIENCKKKSIPDFTLQMMKSFDV
jgi:hypothetical protein